MAGVSNLFTREFFLKARSRLEKGGVFCQWIHLYQISLDDVKCFLQTFHDSFPEVGIFIDGPDMLVLGSEEAILSPAEVLERPLRPKTRKDLERGGFVSLQDMLQTYAGGTRLVEEFSRGAPVNTDNLPILEFTAARNLTEDLSREIRRAIFDAAASLSSPEQGVRP